MALRMDEQERARYAFECIQEFRALNAQLPKNKRISERDYASQLRKLPSMIMHNGLLTTLAFLKSKAKIDVEKEELNDESVVLYQLIRYLNGDTVSVKEDENGKKYYNISPGDLRDYLYDEFKVVEVSAGKGKRKVLQYVRKSKYSEFLEQLLGKSFSEYRFTAMEALRIAQWLKRIAEGEIEDEGKGSD